MKNWKCRKDDDEKILLVTLTQLRKTADKGDLLPRGDTSIHYYLKQLGYGNAQSNGGAPASTTSTELHD